MHAVGHSSPQTGLWLQTGVLSWVGNHGPETDPPSNQLRRGVESHMLFQPLLVELSLYDLTFYSTPGTRQRKGRDKQPFDTFWRGQTSCPTFWAFPIPHSTLTPGISENTQ